MQSDEVYDMNIYGPDRAGYTVDWKHGLRTLYNVQPIIMY